MTDTAFSPATPAAPRAWVRLLTLFAAGLVSALALPPLNQWWVLAFTVPVFLWLLESLA